MKRIQHKKILFGLYDDENDLIKAISQCHDKHYDIWDVFTPFPVHGLDPVLGLKESRLHIAGFVYGSMGTLTAFSFMTWVFTRDWPIIFGGKPYFSAPAFIPITFELTVLFASVGMVLTFYTICGLFPGLQNTHLHDRITDDKFCLAFDVSHAADAESSELQSFLQSTGATEIQTKDI